MLRAGEDELFQFDSLILVCRICAIVEGYRREASSISSETIVRHFLPKEFNDPATPGPPLRRFRAQRAKGKSALKFGRLPISFADSILK